MTGDAGSVVTVTGRRDPGALGTTLPHEHLFADWRETKFDRPDSAHGRRLAEADVSLENRWWVARNYFSNRDNLRLGSYEEAIDEVRQFRRAGGDALVEVTPKGCGGDPALVRAVARETGVDVVQGTAYYVRDAHPDRVDDASVADLAAEFEADVRTGIDDTDVRAGVIGEIGLSGSIHDAEERVLRGAARAARRTGASVTVHPPGATPDSHRDGEWPASRWGHEVLDIVGEEGLPPERVIVCHLDMSAWHEDLDYQRRLAERGAYVEYDIFGQKSHLYKPAHEDAWPSDVQRVERLAELIADGHADRLLVSGDVFLKTHRLAYGGFGYRHVLDNVVPIFDGVGVDPAVVERILSENPARALAFAEPAA
jgi:phosphotriesterase-related protein